MFVFFLFNMNSTKLKNSLGLIWSLKLILIKKEQKLTEQIYINSSIIVMMKNNYFLYISLQYNKSIMNLSIFFS